MIALEHGVCGLTVKPHTQALIDGFFLLLIRFPLATCSTAHWVTVASWEPVWHWVDGGAIQQAARSTIYPSWWEGRAGPRAELYGAVAESDWVARWGGELSYNLWPSTTNSDWDTCIRWIAESQHTSMSNPWLNLYAWKEAEKLKRFYVSLNRLSFDTHMATKLYVLYTRRNKQLWSPKNRCYIGFPWGIIHFNPWTQFNKRQ